MPFASIKAQLTNNQEQNTPVKPGFGMSATTMSPFGSPTRQKELAHVFKRNSEVGNVPFS